MGRKRAAKIQEGKNKLRSKAGREGGRSSAKKRKTVSAGEARADRHERDNVERIEHRVPGDAPIGYDSGRSLW